MEGLKPEPRAQTNITLPVLQVGRLGRFRGCALATAHGSPNGPCDCPDPVADGGCSSGPKPPLSRACPGSEPKLRPRDLSLTKGRPQKLPQKHGVGLVDTPPKKQDTAPAQEWILGFGGCRPLQIQMQVAHLPTSSTSSSLTDLEEPEDGSEPQRWRYENPIESGGTHHGKRVWAASGCHAHETKPWNPKQANLCNTHSGIFLKDLEQTRNVVVLVMSLQNQEGSQPKRNDTIALKYWQSLSPKVASAGSHSCEALQVAAVTSVLWNIYK